MKGAPRVDILMATYNGERYLAEQIDSLRSQTYKNWRLMVSDDCSTDGTVALLRSYEELDERIEMVSSRKRYGGAKENFWNLLSHAEAPYIMFCDQDDVWDDDKIETSLLAMQELEAKHSSDVPLLVFTDMRVVGPDLEVIDESFARYRREWPPNLDFGPLLMTNHAAGCSIMINHALLDVMMKTPDEMLPSLQMHDWWAVLVAAAFGEIAFIDSPKTSYRQHETNALGAVRASLRSLTKLGGVARLFLRVIDQANAFEEVYGAELSPEDRRAIKAFTGSAGGGLKGFRSLMQSGALKTQPYDKMHQFIATVVTYPHLARRGTLSQKRQEQKKLSSH